MSVQVGKRKTEWVEIMKGVRQGFILSPDLFSLQSQKAMEQLEDLEGVRVGGVNLNNIRYADDTVLIADTEEKLQELVETLQGDSAARILHINLG